MTQQEYDYARAACSRPSMSKTDLTAARTPTPDVLPAPPVADTRRRGLLEPPNGAEERMMNDEAGRPLNIRSYRFGSGSRRARHA